MLCNEIFVQLIKLLDSIIKNEEVSYISAVASLAFKF